MRIDFITEKLLREKYKTDPQIKGYNTFYFTENNWSGNYIYEGKEYVACEFIDSINNPSWIADKTQPRYKLIFKGNDDMIMEKYYHSITKAISDLEYLDAFYSIEPEDLRIIGFDYF